MTPKRPGAQPSRRKPCVACGTARAAFTGVEYCFTCWPGGPVTPPPCLRCGSRKDYYTSGVCRRCHRDGNPAVDSCTDCHAWGARRWGNWLCHGCRSWRREHSTIAACRICSTVVSLGEDSICRLCHKQATLVREDKELLDVRAANRHGQQLFFADMFYVSARDRRRNPTPPLAAAPPQVDNCVDQRALRPDAAQLALFPVHRDLSGFRGREQLIDRCEPTLAASIDSFVADHATRHGWTAKAQADTRIGIRILYGFADDPSAPLKARDALVLRPLHFPVTRILRVLAEQNLLIDDRERAVDGWFAAKVADLPAPMRDELGVWFLVMRDGSKIPPRRRPRAEATINVQFRNALPALHEWSRAGVTSLREITREDVLIVLPADRSNRAGCGQALRSIFTILKQRKLVFTNPLARLATGFPEPGTPLPQDPALLREALNSHDPARAVIVALIAYHGLRMGQVRRILLTDIYDGHLAIDQRSIPLAPAVLRRVATYLDDRHADWPTTANPYLLVNSRSAWRDTPVGHRWIQLKIGTELTVQRIREDRILDEAHASQGDTRRISDLFGLSIPAASRYTDTVEHLAFTAAVRATAHAQPRLSAPERSGRGRPSMGVQAAAEPQPKPR